MVSEAAESWNGKPFATLNCDGYLPVLRQIIIPSDFRKINPAALKATFKLFVLFLKDADLIAGEVVAMDGTKIRANNSKKNNYNPKKIARHLAYIEEKTSTYLHELDQNDAHEQPGRVSKVHEKIAKLKANKIRYELLNETLNHSQEPQISTTDTDARALLVQVVEVSYNVQAAVDQKYNLIVATHTLNSNSLSRLKYREPKCNERHRFRNQGKP